MARILLTFMVLLMTACAAAPTPDPARVLIFSHTTGYRHDSIAPGKVALARMVEAEGLEPVLSEDPDVFSAAGLRNVRAIILLSPTTEPKARESEWLTGSRRDALQAFVRHGGGVVGIHAAADSHYHWPWYGQLIGGRFQRHPPGTPTGTLYVIDPYHPSTQGLPRKVQLTDEWYYFRDFDPASNLLVTLARASIGDTEAGSNPISWAREVEGGRVFYTALGHTSEAYAEPLFLQHVRGGLRWALGR